MVSQIFGGELPEWDDEGFCNVEFDHYSLLLIADDQEEQLVAVAVFDEFIDGASPQIYFDALRKSFQAIQGSVPQFSLYPENDAICLFNKILRGNSRFS